ncbi:DsbA family protein [Actinomadura decatromicini]|uniref:Thioredoxin domain-containing protein n=1 Tax=Actinomadura decatromicini TaxID=2604572 RepID=A0A5D3FJ53_9ACTN|nr:thioredoxin domain-containing protein [Actinomadura decatromicini]TYK48012.1 thioredoxin domain-containing protein [Actinomadura decatromicini]
MGNPPNAPWPGGPAPGPGPGAQPPYGPPPPGGWQPGPFGPPPPPRKGGGGLALLLVGGGLVLLLVLVGVVVLVAQGGDDKGGGGGGGGDVRLQVGQIAGGAEATPLADGSLVMARPGVTSPVVDIYEDFACPHCGAFDRMHDPMLKELAVAGRAKVVFHPMVIFGEGNQPAHDNSLRAASALRCVGDGARWLSYQDALYARQPASLETQGYATSDLVAYARPFGLTDAGFTACVENQRYAESVKTVSQGYISSGVQATPSVRVNGRALSTSDTESADALRRAIEAAS